MLTNKYQKYKSVELGDQLTYLVQEVLAPHVADLNVSLMMMCLLECSMFTSSPSIVSQQFPPHLPNENGHDHSDYDYDKDTCEKDNGPNYHQALMVHLLNI